MASRPFWELDENRTVQLEIMSIVSMVPQLDYKVLNINSKPQLGPGSYEEALWLDSLANMANGDHFQSISNMSSSVPVESVLLLRTFINELILFKTKIQKTLLEDEAIDL